MRLITAHRHLGVRRCSRALEVAPAAVHADRGRPMTGKPVNELLVALGTAACRRG